MEPATTETTLLPLVVAVVLNWHGRRQTLACLDALRAMEYGNLAIVLVDNGCVDFQNDSFPAQPPVRYMQSVDNRGFAGGCNLGLATARELGADFVWFLNYDAVPEPAALRLLIAAAQPLGKAVLGPKILRQSTDPPRLDSIAVAVDLSSGRFRLLGHDAIDTGQYDGFHRVDAVTGCAMLVDAELAASLGGFDERYFLYLEDIDLCLRARAAGAAITCVPDARVHHDRPPSRRGRQSDDSLYYTCRNHFLLMATHGRGGGAARALRHATILGLNLAFALLDHPARIPGRLRAVLSGARDYARGRFGPRFRSRVSRPSP